jgi:hypothetical protein
LFSLYLIAPPKIIIILKNIPKHNKVETATVNDRVKSDQVIKKEFFLLKTKAFQNNHKLKASYDI